MNSQSTTPSPEVAASTQQPRQSIQHHIVQYDVIRIIAIAQVMLIHIVDRWAYSFPTVERSSWWLLNAVMTFARPSVPLFVMVSGALLLNPGKPESTRAFFQKRFSKVLIPFVTWSVFYLFWLALINADLSSLVHGPQLFVSGPVYYHLWFMYMIIGLYLITPILREFTRNASRGVLTYFLLIWAGWLIVSALGWFNIRFGVDFYVATDYVGYFVAGYYFSTLTITRRRGLVLIVVVIVCWLVTAIAQYAVASNGDPSNGLAYGYFSPTTVIAAICLFILLRNLPDTLFARLRPSIQSAIVYVSQASFKIYLVHAAILDIFSSSRLGIRLDDPARISSYIGVPLDFLATFMLCLLVVWLVRRIPILKSIA